MGNLYMVYEYMVYGQSMVLKQVHSMRFYGARKIYSMEQKWSAKNKIYILAKC